jgi:squalene synthase HpnC
MTVSALASAAGTPEALASADEVLAKASRENFPVALRIFPAAVRDQLTAVYGFARLVDDAGDLYAGDRLALLAWIEDDLDRAYEGCAEHPLLQRLGAALTEVPLPREPFVRLIDANRRDQDVTRYDTWDELAAYCDLSANPVGELVLHILGAATSERIALSDSVCTGLQLAEHWQDVGEDFALGRIYLPLEDRERFGVAEADLAQAVAGDSLRRLMTFEVERARRLLDDGLPLVASLRGRGRLAIAAFLGGGWAALDAIERSDFDVLRRSPSAGTGARVLAAVRALREAA